MNYAQVKRFFGNFQLFPDTEYKPLPMRTCRLIAQTAKSWYGMEFAEMIANCFVPADPGKVVFDEDQLRFHFEFPSEDEVAFWAGKVDWKRKVNDPAIR